MREPSVSEKIMAQCAAQSWRSPDGKRTFKRCLACCITLKLSRRRRRSAQATGYAEPLRGHCGRGGRQHTEAVPTRRSAEAASALFFCDLTANQEESTSSLVKTGKITAAGCRAGANAARPRGNHGRLLRAIEASARPKTDLQALLSLLHNVEAEPEPQAIGSSDQLCRAKSKALRRKRPTAYRSCTHEAIG